MQALCVYFDRIFVFLFEKWRKNRMKLKIKNMENLIAYFIFKDTLPLGYWQMSNLQFKMR